MPLVYAWARQTGLENSDAADISQEVFRSVFVNLSKFSSEDANSSFRGWLWVITRNQVRQFFRKKKNEPNAVGGSSNHDQIEQAADILESDEAPSSVESKRSLLRRTLEVLKSDFENNTWEAFWRMTIDNHSASDIAKDLKMTAKAVRQAKYRVLGKLREELSFDDFS